MRTGRALTVSGARGGVHPRRIFLGENKLKKKKKKQIQTPPQNSEQTPPPENLGQTPPPQNLGQTPPPENLGQTPPQKIWVRHPPQKFGSDTPPRVDRQTPVNLLPWPNFVAAGKNYGCRSNTVGSIH